MKRRKKIIVPQFFSFTRRAPKNKYKEKVESNRSLLWSNYTFTLQYQNMDEENLEQLNKIMEQKKFEEEQEENGKKKVKRR